jgi:F-type H+-transporting ATPase subunit a
VANDPISQFQIKNIVPIEIGGLDLSFTNSSLFMVATVGVAAGFLFLTTANRGLVPSRLQSISEMSYEFVASMLRDGAGSQGMRFFPMVFSLFMFVLVANLLGMFPYFFTVTSHLIITFALAMLVIGTVVVYGFWKHGLHFLQLFVPSGVPGVLMPLVVMIEVISFLSRPISLSVRLFANMLAGHITLKVFAGFVVSLGSLGALGIGGNSAAHHDRGADRSRIPRRLPSGLRLCGADLHVPQRRPASRPLGSIHRRQAANKFASIPFQRSFIMEAEAAKYIGAGIACLGMGGAGIGLGNIFGSYLSGALRNPSAADGQFGRLIFGFAVTEALGIFSLLVALLLLFAV